MNDLERLFLRELREMFDAEHLLVCALAELAYYAESPLLKFAFRHHKSQTEKHVKRLEQVFRELGQVPDRKPCDGIEGIIDDAQVTVMEFLGNSALDAGLIAAAQKAEHYEIVTYGTLCCWARELGLEGVFALLEENLKDEKATDRNLTLAAESLRNPAAKRHNYAKRSAQMAEFLKEATHAG